MRHYRFVHVDVFTSRAFGGNQLAVFTDAQGLSDVEMQAIAFEMNFSESTFVLPPDDPLADARVRVFTPLRELPFAGHPVVGTGYVLSLERGKREVALQLKIDTLKVRADASDSRVGSSRMEQPVPRFRPAEADEVALAALVNLAPEDIAPNPPASFGSAGVEFLFLPIRSLEAVRRAHGDASAMQQFFEDPHHAAVYLFTLETESTEAAAHARMLSLSLGSDVREDPATGSAAGPCGAYLLRQGLCPPGRIVIEQGYEMGRPSQIEVDVESAGGEVSRVRVGGGVVRVGEGELFL